MLCVPRPRAACRPDARAGAGGDCTGRGARRSGRRCRTARRGRRSTRAPEAARIPQGDVREPRRATSAAAVPAATAARERDVFSAFGATAAVNPRCSSENSRPSHRRYFGS